MAIIATRLPALGSEKDVARATARGRLSWLDVGKPSQPLSLFPRRPGADPEKTGVAGTVGGGAMRAASGTYGLVATLVDALSSPRIPGATARRVARQMAMRHVFHTAFEALPLVSAIGALVGATIVLQLELLGGLLPGDWIGQAIIAVILRELAPLATATIVAARTGTTIATELGNMSASGETLALRSLGIDVQRFVVWPRLVGAVVGVTVLTVYFGLVALFSIYVIGLMIGASSAGPIAQGLAHAFGLRDHIVYAVKCVGMGTIVGWFACHFGLSVRGVPTNVPPRASQAVIYSLLVCVLFNAAVTAGFFVLTGGRR